LLLGGVAVRDIISQGEDRERSPWPRRLAAIAALGVLLVVGIVWYLPRHRPAPPRPPRAAISVAPAPLLTARPAGPGQPPGPDGIAGPTARWAASVRLPAAGQQPSWYWPGTGRSAPIGGLPRDPSGYVFRRVGGGWAVQPDPAAYSGCGSCPGPPRPVYFLADRAPSVARVGLADEVTPAATAGAMWLTSFPPDSSMSTAAGTAREVSVAGAPLRSRLRLPAGYVIDQATDRGLLLAPALPRPGMTADQLWNPAVPADARAAGRLFARVIAASPAAVAWTPPCAPRCRTHVLNLATGRDTVVRLPAGSSAASSAFSPDGRFLALQVSFGSGGDGGALAMQLEVASVATGRLTAVPGTWASSDALVGFGWPAAGDRLVAELSFMTKMQLVSWHPGAVRPAVAVVRPGRSPPQLIVG
jgi:hypothetical protein